MADREKVENALYCRSDGFGLDCKDCDYYRENTPAYCNFRQILRDAKSMLKEQNETIKELQNAYGYLQKQFFEVQDELLKEQEGMLVEYSVFDGIKYGGCPRCNARIDNLVNPKACGYCGQVVKWDA